MAWTTPTSSGLFVDTFSGRRRLALILYALVVPPFAVTSYLASPSEAVGKVATLWVLAICGVATLQLLLSRPSRPLNWVFPVSVAPIC